MQKISGSRGFAEAVAGIVADAGGELVGRTRLQKIAYFLEAVNQGAGFDFSYRHFGPYSEELSSSAKLGQMLSLLLEEEKPTNWGGTFSIYKSALKPKKSSRVRKEIIGITKDCNPIALELAATALFLKKEGVARPWDETARRKPEKASPKMLEQSKALYEGIAKAAEGKLPSVL